MNETGKSQSFCAETVPLARYELIDKDGNVAGKFFTATSAAGEAARLWPDQSYDEDRDGTGWCVRVAGAGQ